MSQDFLAERCNHRSATAGIARIGFDQRLGPAPVHHFYQQPRPPIAHPKRPARGGDRAFSAYRLEQVGLARSHRDLVATVELNLDLERERGRHAAIIGSSDQPAQPRSFT